VSRRGGPPRPVRAVGPVLLLAFALTAWLAVAHNSGSGWVQALGGLLAGFAAVGLFGPWVATGRLRVTVAANPTDADAGRPVAITVSVSGPARVAGVKPPGPVATIGTGAGPVEIVASRRGPLDEVVVSLASAAPFGLLWWRKQVVVPLARTMWVAPAPGPPDPRLVTGTAAGHVLDQPRPRHTPAGEPRGIRPYEPGDPRRLVHWPASAHRGELMVREVERPEAALPVLRAILPDDGPAGDALAARAMGTLLDLLSRSAPVMLMTVERDGLRTEPVFGPADAGRRLARAVAAR
jgi:uncharacterized protein (DUF58 family)